MELHSSVISKHLIRPPPDGPNELDRSNPIVGHKDLLNHTLATIATHKFTWSCNLNGGGKEEGGRGGGERGKKNTEEVQKRWEKEKEEGGQMEEKKERSSEEVEEEKERESETNDI